MLDSTPKGNHDNLDKTHGSAKMHSVALDIPEILKEVMLLSERAECATSARVCRGWSSVAIDVLWHDLESIFPLLELIAPLELDSKKRLVSPFAPTCCNASLVSHIIFAADIVHFKVFPAFALVWAVDWPRFDSYARRVRTLSYHETEDYWTRNGHMGVISKSMFMDISLNSPTSRSLLPNVSKVFWTVDNTPAVLMLLSFLSSRTQSLLIELGSKCPDKTINTLLNRLGDRAPGVLDFNLSIHNKVDDVDEGLATCLGRMEKLQNVTLPRGFGAPRVVAALTHLMELRLIQTHEWAPYGWHRAVSQLGTQWDTRLDAFETLETLDFQTTPRQAVSVLTCPTPSRLQSVGIATIGTISNSELTSLLFAIATSCPLLQNLQLNLFSSWDHSPERLRFETLEPLFGCRSLQLLKLGHPRPILLTEENLVAIATVWPVLHSLSMIGGRPLTAEHNPLSILKAFARHLPRIRHVALHCRVDSNVLQMGTGSAAFESLRHLDVSLSAISPRDIGIVTAFLGFTCPPGLVIHHGVSVWQTDAMGLWESGKHGDLWDAVGHGVRAFHQIQGEKQGELDHRS